MEMYHPQLVNELTAELQMPNPWQHEQMRKELPRLLAALRKELHNDHLTITVSLAEYSQEQMATTAEEKYKLMTESNPLLATLKEKLDLVID